MNEIAFRENSNRAIARALVALAFFISAGAASAAYTAAYTAADPAADVVGSWRLISHRVSVGASTFDSQAGLFEQKPCAAKIRDTVNADGMYRLYAEASDCDEISLVPAHTCPNPSSIRQHA